MIRVWRIPFSTNVERVALALAHKRLSVDWVDVPRLDRSQVIAVSGQPLVPVLEEDGRVIHDSTAILDYLEDRYPEPPLYPREESRHAEARILLDWFNRVWKRPPNELEAELLRGEPDKKRVEELAAAMRSNLDRHEALLAGHDYLFDDAFSAADCAAFPFLKYALAREPDDDELFHRILGDYQSVKDRPRLESWIRRVDERPRA
jgi:glutathione S-transferase